MKGENLYIRVIAMIAAILMGVVIASTAKAACKWVWIDHDGNALTPAKRTQVCDNTYDPPVIQTPEIRPIQPVQPRPTRPLLGLPPLGTTKCEILRVYENGKWVRKKVCR